MTDFNLVLSQVRQRLEILYQIVDELEQQGGGGGGTSDYTQLENLPKLNSKTITGSHDGSYYGLADAAALDDKADKSTTYTKTEVNGLLDDKADKSTTYTKTEVNGLLNDKADKSTTYTKTETNSYVQGEIAGAILDLDATSVGGSTKYITTISEANGIIDATAETSDTVPTAGSDKLVRSQGIKTYVDTAEANAKADWFLRGPIIPTGTNFNTLTTPGHYYVNSNDAAGTMTNMPVPYGGRLEITAIIGNTSYLRQTYYANTDSVGLICIRRQNSSETGWSKWVIFPEAFGTGTTITATSGNSFNIDTIDVVGRYTYSATSAPYLLGLPSNAITTVGGEIIVENIQNTNRFVMRLYLNGQSQAGRFWQRFYTLLTSSTAGWTPWYMFEGTEVAASASLNSISPLQMGQADLTVEENEIE